MAPPPPELMDDAVGEILLRIPPDDPTHLLRASLVCKPWRRLLTDPAFLRRYRAFHRAPPVLGFVRNQNRRARFIPTSSFRPPDPERRYCQVLDCRHGHILLYHASGNFLVWDPITGVDRRVPVPNTFESFSSYNAVVLCAATDCDHLDCHGGPFLVVLVATYSLILGGKLAGAWVYSSEVGKWSKSTTVQRASLVLIEKLPPVLAGDKLYSTIACSNAILRYDLRNERDLSISQIQGCSSVLYGTFLLIPAEDGGLRLAGLNNKNDCKIDLWSLETMDPDGVATWTQQGVIQLDTLLSAADSTPPLNLIGFAKAPDAYVVFVSTGAGVFMIGLESHKVTKVYDKDCGDQPIFPYSSFFTPDSAMGRLPLPQG
ncbi:hypothetical protein QOZ80_5BG0454540 [Eleusine coracana subsp. coracana]|nr:hypothetical protein QOZ80_5BG0454540 [Eleusine coracana subsp. coracana]